MDELLTPRVLALTVIQVFDELELRAGQTATINMLMSEYIRRGWKTSHLQTGLDYSVEQGWLD